MIHPAANESSDGSTKQSAEVEEAIHFALICTGSSDSRAQGQLNLGWLCIQTIDAYQ